jgi:ATP-dependent DNA helicase RecQ
MGNHLQLAFGAGKDEHFPIDLNAFCEKYSFGIIPAYNSLKLLEAAGYIELTEGIYQPSRLKITASQMQLYQEQVKDPGMNTLIQFILRTHMGIFDDYVNINEFIIAQKIKSHQPEVIRKLEYLAKLELVDYIAKNTKPAVTYLTERLPEANVVLQPRFYQERKDVAFEKMKAMIRFLESDECRSVMLLSYFGEQESERCGKCPECLKKSGIEQAHNRVRDYVVSGLMRTNELETSAIMASFPLVNQEQVFVILRRMADDKVIYFDETARRIRAVTFNPKG